MRDRFRAAGIDTPELDARLLGQKAFGLDPMGLVRKERDPAPPDALKTLDQFAQRRLAGEPISRIAGEKEFWGLRFGLNDDTLVPRPETEQLVQEGLAFLEGQTPQTIVTAIDEGVRVIAGHNLETARVGRAHQNRAMPV